MGIRVGIIGVGNCASALVQGAAYYTQQPAAAGMISPEVRGLGPQDIEFVIGFDVDKRKVGLPITQAIFEGENNTYRMGATLPPAGEVYAAPVLDGLGHSYRKRVTAQSEVMDVGALIKAARVDVLINYLPVGSETASRWWAEMALSAGVAFINTIPVFVAREFGSAFAAAGLPLIGDDVKSQVGATIVHRHLARLLCERGFKVERTYQLNFGGNMDFFNMLDRERLASKKESKTNAVQAELSLPAENIHISPSDYVSFLLDRKWAYLFFEGTGFGGAPFRMETKLEVWDSPNSAGVVLDLVRYAYAALMDGQGGVLPAVSALYMKSPPVQLSEQEAVSRLEEEGAF